MKRLVFAVAILLLFVPVRAAEDFTGKWSGAFAITSPEQKDDVVLLDLKQKGTELTGTAGPSAEEQWPLKGTVDGNKLGFRGAARGRRAGDQVRADVRGRPPEGRGRGGNGRHEAGREDRRPARQVGALSPSIPGPRESR